MKGGKQGTQGNHYFICNWNISSYSRTRNPLARSSTNLGWLFSACFLINKVAIWGFAFTIYKLLIWHSEAKNPLSLIVR